MPADSPTQHTIQELSLTEGRLLRCPHCEQLRDPMDPAQFKRYGRNPKYAQELNVVYECRKKTGGCGHVFSPGDQRILIAFLQGDLVPAESVNYNGEEVTHK